MSRRNENRNDFALILLSGALVFFAAFHVLPIDSGGRQRGYRFWVELARDLDRFGESLASAAPDELIAIMAFLMMPLLLIASPFLTPVYKSSKAFHGLALILALVSTAGFTGIILVHWGPNSRPGSGLSCLMVAQVFNVLGLALVRHEKTPKLGTSAHR